MLLFWERGFEGTSIAELSQVMGINASSMYAAFGDKHALFILVVQRYLESRTEYATNALAQSIRHLDGFFTVTEEFGIEPADTNLGPGKTACVCIAHTRLAASEQESLGS